MYRFRYILLIAGGVDRFDERCAREYLLEKEADGEKNYKHQNAIYENGSNVPGAPRNLFNPRFSFARPGG
ncbi:hypothetical protein [Burkholderia ubonensis]|uniref:hypothetical protein n=1 Tax=Burkholderia ubonensis TaxID=101571 RepID=UPI000B2F3E13|nr:hypothetical protein [Burkholderia ubonensis]